MEQISCDGIYGGEQKKAWPRQAMWKEKDLVRFNLDSAICLQAAGSQYLKKYIFPYEYASNTEVQESF